MRDRFLFELATLIALGATLWSFVGRGAERRPFWNNVLLFLAFATQSGFLYLRGEQIGRCPLTNAFEATAFLSWSLLLTYFITGSAYRLSILGSFTAPFVLLLNLIALLFTRDSIVIPTTRISGVIELHAALSVLAYGTLGLAAIASTLYLIQEHQLKAHHLGGWFYRLPSVGDLETVQRRVLGWGFILLTVGMISGIPLFTTAQTSTLKVAWAIAVWLWYLMVLTAPRLFQLSHHKTAWASSLGYALVLISFWGVAMQGASR